MSALDRQAAIATALSAALLADADFGSLIGLRVYDAPPARAVMPSVTIRLVTARDASSADTEAQALDFDLDVWDRYALGETLGRPRAVMGHIRRILHLRPLAVPGIDVVTVRCVASRGPARDPDELALHGTVSVTVLAGHEAPLA